MVIMSFIEEYLSDAGNKLSDNSKAQYRSILNAYIDFIDMKPELATHTEVAKYINHLKTEKKLTTGSIVVFISVIRKFYNYMVESGHMNYNPVGRMRLAVGGELKNPDEIESLLEEASTNPRKYIEVMLTQHYDVRMNELLSIRKEDLDFSRRTLVLHDGESVREIQISRDMSVILQCYTEYMVDEDLIFQLSERARLRDTRIASTARRQPQLPKPKSKLSGMRIPRPITPPFTTRRI